MSINPPTTIRPEEMFRVWPVPLSHVRLLEGILKERQDVHAGFLLSVEPDRMLAPFRAQAGLPPVAESYGGWESRDIRGHSLGHYLSALSLLYASLGDEAVRGRIDALVAGIAACQEANGDGYVLPVRKEAFEELRAGKIDATPFSLNGIWVPFYTMHKLLAGLRDAHHLAGNADALAVARRLADWLAAVLAPLDADQVQRMLRAEHGGMNEVLADLAADTGDGRYLEMAQRYFHHLDVMGPMLRGEDRLDGLHGNTQIPKAIGLAREYELTNDPPRRLAAESFWDTVVNRRSYCVGGHGESEHFFPVEQFPRRLTPNTCETCNTYNMLKLTGHLHAWSPEASRMDFVERALINHLAANIGRQPGEFGYFLGLGSVGVKVFSTPFDAWWCCVGTGMENPARYGELIYFQDAASLWVNLYAGSTVEWPGKAVKLRQETNFPEAETVCFIVTCGRPVRFALKLRHPGWCENPEVRINGEQVETGSSRSSYMGFEREWRDGDRVELRLPMTLRLEALPHSPDDVFAVLYGPTVLAAIVPETPGTPSAGSQRYGEHLQARGKTDAFPPLFVAAGAAEILAGLQPTGKAFAEFRSSGIVKPQDLTFVPLYRIYEEQYAVYLPRLGVEEWHHREGEIRAAQAERVRQEAGTLDRVTPGYQQPEVEHSLLSENSEIEDFADRKCRLARDGGWFSYRLAVGISDPVVLVVTYWGGVWHERNFDLLLDGQPLTSQRLLTNRPGDFFDQTYDVPPELTQGKASVTIRFQSRPGDIAGGVFGVCLMRADAAPAERFDSTFVYKTH